MTDHPIIFSAPMVLALLEGRKTMTRRLAWRFSDVNDNHTKTATSWQKVKPGDRLWVRESLQRFDRETQYVATMTGVVAGPGIARHSERALWEWGKSSLPSIHMPRWASRLTLTVTATKVEGLQEITREEAIAEGVENYGGERDWRVGDCEGTDPVAAFSALWWSLHGIGAWNENPEVVALTFRVTRANIDSMEKAA